MCVFLMFQGQNRLLLQIRVKFDIFTRGILYCFFEVSFFDVPNSREFRHNLLFFVNLIGQFLKFLIKKTRNWNVFLLKMDNYTLFQFKISVLMLIILEEFLLNYDSIFAFSYYFLYQICVKFMILLARLLFSAFTC